ncbi:MAG: hypothetical protein HY886_05505 [Deltaproteobacteria bacterium]|nr:hypothetical protein [Deltaproteobacteria bacterium]
MNGKKIFHQKKMYPDGAMVEMKIWRVEPDGYRPHGLKYSLAYIEKGKGVVGYDNAERKGDHRHYERMTVDYEFCGVDKLMDDFLKDVHNRRKRYED